MALQKCGLKLNRSLQELNPHGSPDFPCAGYSSLYRRSRGEMIPWHWHEEMEILHVSEGCLELKLPEKTFLVRAGDAFAINSNVLHSGSAAGTCRLQSLVFSPELICGGGGSVFAVKYMRPLTRCSAFTGLPVLRSDSAERILDFCRAFDAIEKEPPGFEFTVRESLSRFCFFLAELFRGQFDLADEPKSRNDMRIKTMLEYIHRHYAEEITLPEIARSAHIGERECLRCFQKTIQCSPMQYLLKYRVTQGAGQLLRQPGKSVSETALSCGFDSSSYFSRMFRRFYGVSPREYRKSEARR